MKPGRELDALIAEKVMGEKAIKTTWGKTKQYSSYSLGEPDYYDDQGDMILSNPLPGYSKDIAAAWQVVEKMKVDSHIKIQCFPVEDPHYHSCGVEILRNRETVSESSYTVPHAICLAALRALGLEIEK